MQVTDGVYLVGSGALGFDLTDQSDCHVYLVTGEETREATLIDAGSGINPEAILANIDAAGVATKDVTRLLLTHAHADHAGGAAALREALPNLQVFASSDVVSILSAGDELRAGVGQGKASGVYPASYRYHPCEMQSNLVDGDIVNSGEVTFSVLSTPGHSTGHTCYVATVHGKKILFSGDHLFVGGRIALQNTWDCRLDQYVASLQRLAGLEVDALFPGHLRISLNGASRHINHALTELQSGLLPKSIV
jgi:hydroxyacylglutathione hydrolase